MSGHRVVIVLLVIVMVVGISYFALSGSAQDVRTFVQQQRAQVAPTPSAYEAMTIPALRERTYQSTLGERQVYEQQGSYTSYLTSYDSDGLRIDGLLTVPTGDMPEGGWPSIVFVHGYIPPTLYETTSRYVAYVDSLARAGFVVFKIDLRGHGNSEGVPGGAYYSADYVVDVLNARAALASSDMVNPQKIGLWGHSMAGNVVLRATAARPEIPATTIWAGAVYTYEDMRTYGISDNSYRPPVTTTPRAFSRQRLYESVGSPSAESPFWKRMAPTSYLGDFTGAVQIHHAINDDVVNVAYSRDLNALLEKARVEHEFYEYPTGGHDIEGISFGTAMQRTVDFYRRHL